MRRYRLRTSLAAAFATLLALPAGALAGRAQESIFQDDRLLFEQGEERQQATLDELDALGVDVIHTVVLWRRLAPDPESPSRPDAFDGRDPASYGPSAWDRLDALVRGARARGMEVLVSPAGPAPEWAVTCTAAERRQHERGERGTCKPDPSLYGDLVTALGRRYNGSYPDETDGAPLPSVRRWSIWNEPNLSSWISPQIERVRRRRVLTGARIYRSLVDAGLDALRATGHARDQLLLGETAPIGGSNRNAAPVDFYLALLCVDPRGRRLRGTAARDLGCSGADRMPVNGVAHHPYTRGAGQNLLKRQRLNSITIRDIPRLERVLQLGARGRLIPSSLRRRIHFTEFGVSSRPPGRRFSVPLPVQAEWINWFEYLAYQRSSVRSVAQLALEDDANITSMTFQTGLRFSQGPQAGQDKPSYAAYRMPLYVVRAGRRVRIFGGARPAANGQTVEILNGGRRVSTARVRFGWFQKTVAFRPGTWQLRWRAPGGQEFESRTARVRGR